MLLLVDHKKDQEMIVDKCIAASLIMCIPLLNAMCFVIDDIASMTVESKW